MKRGVKVGTLQLRAGGEMCDAAPDAGRAEIGEVNVRALSPWSAPSMVSCFDSCAPLLSLTVPVHPIFVVLSKSQT